ncbi:MAG TPA: tRNA (adenosine(37)-N6)-threonylcarbamoyltransferase complex transferase subunit TsaD [Clostridia bacterium]|nr:tRNA (adenosine(37)-N6)-threonylcarbamoyltransferase complex transferase subunit TsaD [Clostridia bacterium]
MGYRETALLRVEEYRHKRAPLTLGIESSCDETAAAVLRGARETLSSSVYTQIPLHRKYGGVVPELASRSHVEKVGAVVADALEQAGASLADIDAIAVTNGPGLVGALLVGLSYAKGLAYAAGKPLVGVDHIAGHIAANYLTYPDLAPPFACLVASGGHSHIVLVEDYTRFSLIGKTRDDAAGEAFDKVARALGLPYPGGPALEALAKEGDPSAFRFRAGLALDDSFDYSFSGVKTAVVNLMHTAEQRGESLCRADIAASFQKAVVDALCVKAVRAAKAAGVTTLALAGGVSANGALREELRKRAEAAGFRFCVPALCYCMDNAAMIACAGHYALLCNAPDPLSLNAHPSRELA